jgi:hypothetical protein
LLASAAAREMAAAESQEPPGAAEDELDAEEEAELVLVLDAALSPDGRGGALRARTSSLFFTSRARIKSRRKAGIDDLVVAAAVPVDDDDDDEAVAVEPEATRGDGPANPPSPALPS